MNASGFGSRPNTNGRSRVPEQRTPTVTKSGAGTGAVSKAAAPRHHVQLRIWTSACEVALTATPVFGDVHRLDRRSDAGTGDCQVTLGGDRRGRRHVRQW